MREALLAFLALACMVGVGATIHAYDRWYARLIASAEAYVDELLKDPK